MVQNNTQIPGVDQSIINNSVQAVGILSTLPNGFPNREDCIIDFDKDGTKPWNIGGIPRLFMIAPSTTTYTIYSNGQSFVKQGMETVQITDTEGIWFFYFDTDFALRASQAHWDLASGIIPISVISWDKTTQQEILLLEERHSTIFSAAEHEYLHDTRGTAYERGLGLNNFTTLGNGNNDSDSQVGIDDGVIRDEDIIVDVTNNAIPTEIFEQVLSPVSEIPVYYLKYEAALGTDAWRKKSATQFPVYENAGANNRIGYNLNSAPNWSISEANQNNYVAMWIYATNNSYEPIIAVIGQRQDNTLSNAKDNNSLADLVLTNMPFQEIKPLFRLIFQTNSTYANTPKARLQDVLDLRNTIQFPSQSYVGTAHASLTGKDFNSSGHTGFQRSTYQSAIDPGINNDGADTAGIGISFIVGNTWINTSSGEIFRCTNNSTGAAVWVKTYPQGGGSIATIASGPAGLSTAISGGAKYIYIQGTVSEVGTGVINVPAGTHIFGSGEDSIIQLSANDYIAFADDTIFRECLTEKDFSVAGGFTRAIRASGNRWYSENIILKYTGTSANVSRLLEITGDNANVNGITFILSSLIGNWNKQICAFISSSLSTELKDIKIELGGITNSGDLIDITGSALIKIDGITTDNRIGGSSFYTIRTDSDGVYINDAHKCSIKTDLTANFCEIKNANDCIIRCDSAGNTLKNVAFSIIYIDISADRTYMDSIDSNTLLQIRSNDNIIDEIYITNPNYLTFPSTSKGNLIKRLVVSQAGNVNIPNFTESKIENYISKNAGAVGINLGNNCVIDYVDSIASVLNISSSSDLKINTIYHKSTAANPEFTSTTNGLTIGEYKVLPKTSGTIGAEYFFVNIKSNDVAINRINNYGASKDYPVVITFGDGTGGTYSNVKIKESYGYIAFQELNSATPVNDVIPEEFSDIFLGDVLIANVNNGTVGTPGTDVKVESNDVELEKTKISLRAATNKFIFYGDNIKLKEINTANEINFSDTSTNTGFQSNIKILNSEAEADIKIYVFENTTSGEPNKQVWVLNNVFASGNNIIFESTDGALSAPLNEVAVQFNSNDAVLTRITAGAEVYNSNNF